MEKQFNIKTITDEEIKDKRILVRVDYNVSLTETSQIADDTRITQTLPTLHKLLEGNNKLILVAHLGQPKERDPKFSLHPVVERLQTYLPDKKILLVNDFLSEEGRQQVAQQTPDQILMLENIRFYPGEKTNDPEFAQQLASLVDIYVDDAFGVCHRPDASVVGVAKLLPSYAGLLLEKEITAIGKIVQNPKKPFVAIIGGAKTSTKLPLLYKLTEIADYLLLGGGIANTFLLTQGLQIGKSIAEPDQKDEVQKIINHAKEKNTQIVLIKDAICAIEPTALSGNEYMIGNIPTDQAIFDIGPETQAIWGHIIDEANTIVWNGPVGYMENPAFNRGTDFLYYAITQNDHAFSVVGGGDTLVAITKKEYLEKITHISTGGGAMLEFIEKGTLPGIEALRQQ
jgi:phosphoglycerate kinase